MPRQCFLVFVASMVDDPRSASHSGVSANLAPVTSGYTVPAIAMPLRNQVVRISFPSDPAATGGS